MEVTTEDGVQRRELTVSRSYQSQVEAVLTFGLGASTSAAVRVVWPDGTESEYGGLEIDRLHVLEQPAS